MYADYKIKDTTINLIITTSMLNKQTIITPKPQNPNVLFILIL